MPRPSRTSDVETSIPPVEKARRLFQDAGLAFPSIPEELARRLKEIGEWCFATRRIKVDPYLLRDYVMDTGRTRGDYILLAHSGHGVNSYAIQYYLVYRCLRMFLHLGWGGAHMDNGKERAKIRECFELADQLVQQAKALSWHKHDERMTVVVSDFYGSYWVPPPEVEEGRDKLIVVLGEAIDCLAARRSKPIESSSLACPGGSMGTKGDSWSKHSNSEIEDMLKHGEVVREMPITPPDKPVTDPWELARQQAKRVQQVKDRASSDHK